MDAPWGAPVPLPPTINTATTEFAPSLAQGDHLLLFGSDREGGCGGQDIWASFRADASDDFGWEAPVNLGCAVNSVGADDGPTWFEQSNGSITLFFTSLDRPGGLGDYDVWTSTRNADGSFTPAVPVAEVNSPDRDTRTTIRRDGLEIVFTSNRPGSVSDSFDLWVATRATPAGAWPAPVNLGPPVNGPFNDGAPALSSDGASLYFYSNRPGGSGANDLFVARRTRVGPAAWLSDGADPSGSPR